MGLFSSKKNAPANTSIPPEILADVSVNGVKRGASSGAAPANLPVQAASSSPFLKGRVGSTSAEPVASSGGPSPAPAPSPASPAPSQLTDPSPASAPTGEIHFTDTPSSPKTSVPNPFLASAPSSQEEALPTPTTSFTPPSPDQPANPFTRKPDFSQIAQDKTLQKKAEEIATGKTPSKKQKAKRSFPWANIISISVFLLILALISGGSWYYLQTRSINQEEPEVSIEELAPPSEAPEASASSSEASSILVDQPNYLIIDVETATLEQIKVLIAEEHEKITAEGISVPVEYLVVDKNNNPVAFSRFALLVGADTPNELVNASLEPFSLYLFTDQGAPRMALAITLKAGTPPGFPANKTALPQSLKQFFYPNEMQSLDISTFVFSATSYKNAPISYINLDQSKNLSFDLSSQEGVLTVANSKNTLRAVIDKRLLVPEQ